MKIITQLVSLIIMLSIGSAHATTIQALSMEQRTERADRVIIGEVQHIRYEKASTAQRIYTITTIKVIESLKGNAKKDMLLTVRQIGGQMGEWSQHVPGDARFEKQEEVLVFLRHDPRDDLHFLVGMAQGKLTVDTATDRIGKSTHHTHGRSLHVHGLQKAPNSRHQQSLSELRNQIQIWLRSTVH